MQVRVTASSDTFEHLSATRPLKAMPLAWSAQVTRLAHGICTASNAEQDCATSSVSTNGKGVPKRIADDFRQAGVFKAALLFVTLWHEVHIQMLTPRGIQLWARRTTRAQR